MSLVVSDVLMPRVYDVLSLVVSDVVSSCVNKLPSDYMLRIRITLRRNQYL